MRLRTIWTLRDMSSLERLRRTSDWAAMEIGHHLPLRIRYWTTVQELARASRDTQGHVMAMPLEDIMKNLDRPKRVS